MKGINEEKNIARRPYEDIIKNNWKNIPDSLKNNPNYQVEDILRPIDEWTPETPIKGLASEQESKLKRLMRKG